MAQVFQNGRQLLRSYAQRLKQKRGSEKRLTRELQQEREKRRRAESELRRFQNPVSPADAEVTLPAVTKRPDPLSEPDESISRVGTFLSLISPIKPIRNGEFDLICIFGLMHHLELKDQVKLLERCSGTYTLATVRVAPEALVTEGPYEGLYRHERGESREERDQIPQASWGNEVDFWHTEESLMRMMRDCGYGKVMAMRPPHRPYYTFYLCLPPSGPQPKVLSK
jgi:hypothetical protein